MQLSWTQAYHGASPLAAEPVVVGQLRATPAECQQAASAAVALQRHYPHWLGAEPDPSPAGAMLQESALPAVAPGEPGLAGLERLARQAVRWALAALNEVRGYLHEAGAAAGEEGVQLWVGFHDPQLSQSALQLALQTALRSVQADFSPAMAEPALQALWQQCRQRHPDYQAHILMSAARHRGVPVLPFDAALRLWQFGWGQRSRVFFESNSNHTGPSADPCSG
ncbi:hypothetical protein [Pseudomonas sp. NW5]|uniref:hypothetical protein n=1 Tax=Pseudomonas sp. NW5 TaxID=2934934 RepID=UPI002020EC27|nr:hypothetical protein [Pseudomonas sp. NW5]MCL7462255.1 hypothetical protein [Pseudomonas sp. NW5]